MGLMSVLHVQPTVLHASTLQQIALRARHRLH